MAVSHLPPNSPGSGEPLNLTREGLEQLRKRLLDLTRRNKLLSFRHGAKSCLRVVDELPDELFSHLKDEKKLIFRPVPEPDQEERKEVRDRQRALPRSGPIPDESSAPEPGKVSAKEHAAKLGIKTSYDLPEPGEKENPRHFDKIIQTLHYPDELEAILGKINGSARTALEESGTNMLYLVFGFLEWYESADSTDPLYSPLLTLPVELSRNKPSRISGGMFEFSIEHTGEDLLTNLSLVERMKRDFGLSIPMLEDDETPERYFKKFRKILKAQPRWRIRRQITLSLLHFGKLLMFMDLDVSKSSTLLSHPRVKELLEGASPMEDASQSDETSYGEVYELDHPIIGREFPHIIYDADSSQHSALIDAMRGRNLVIEGPPGTGKSQTITNLIAAFLVQGKSVLFVAEKLTALEVVRRRLDRAGLGHFCLELHSHKTKKDKFLQDIHQRILKQRVFRDSADLDDKIRLCERNKKELVQYVQLINQPFGNLRKTIFDIIWARDNCLEQHRFLENFEDHLAFEHADQTTPSEREHQQLLLDIYQQQMAMILESCTSIGAHPWSGVKNSRLSYIQEREVLDKIGNLRMSLAQISEETQSLSSLTGASFGNSFKSLQQLSVLCPLLPQLDGNEHVGLISRLNDSDSRACAQQFLDSITAWEEDRENLHQNFTQLPFLDVHTQDELRKILLELQTLGLGEQTKLGLSMLAAHVQELHRSLKNIVALFDQAMKRLQIVHPCTLKSLPHLAAVFILLKETNFDILYLRHPALGNPFHDQARKKGQAEAQAICSLKSQLSEEYTLGRLPSSDELWAHVSTVSSSTFFGRLFDVDYKAARNSYRSLSKLGGKVNWTMMAKDLKELAEYQDRVKCFSCDTLYQEAFGSCFRGIETPFEELAQLQGWYTELRTRLAPYEPNGQPLLNALQTLPDNTLRTLTAYLRENISLVELSGTLPIQLNGLPFVSRSMNNASTNLVDLIVEMGRVSDFLRQAVDRLLPVPFLDHVIVEKMPSLLEQVAAFRKTEQALNNEAEVSSLLEVHYRGCLTKRRGVEATLKLIRNVHHEDIPTDIQNWLLTSEYSARSAILAKQLKSLSIKLSHYRALWVEFTEFVELDLQQWYDTETGKEWNSINMDLISTHLDRAQSAPFALSGWLEYIRSRKALEEVRLTAIISLSENGQLEPDQLQNAYKFALYNGLTIIIFKANPTLLNFSRNRHEKIREQFVKLDNEILDLYRDRAAYQISRRTIPPGNGSGPVRDFTDRALLDHEIQKQRGHIPIRALVNRAHKALLALKPCFMMGPMSVAQYLQPERFHFDLVVMDEASQLKPEDAIGAIARGSQVVIVGDPKQLPPTSFFETMFVEPNGSEEEDDSLAIEESESILDRACEVYRPIRQLRWHYRSRHESLIAFSNHRFYNNNLTLFPSPHRDSSELGIKYHFVHEGVYSNRANRPEAERIVKAILTHMTNYPNESLGVATFNTVQMELINQLLDAEEKKNPFVQVYKAKWLKDNEEFFIRNLETIQGHERDCIFVSFTYGHDANGNMYQRFGPVNGNNGHRRLNVLFTRSKLRTEVFTSMHPEDVLVGPESSLGVKAMRSYLTYAKTGVLEQAQVGDGAEPNDFEIAVGNSLKDAGLDVHSQIGVAGYFIDLAVCHPNRVGSYILGIECDGATYHSAKSARDRDRLRQSNLENLGWKIHRIWSTDWFRNRSVEVERIKQKVHNLARGAELR